MGIVSQVTRFLSTPLTQSTDLQEASRIPDQQSCSLSRCQQAGQQLILQKLAVVADAGVAGVTPPCTHWSVELIVYASPASWLSKCYRQP